MQRKLDKQKPSKNGGTKNTLYEWDGQQLRYISNQGERTQAAIRIAIPSIDPVVLDTISAEGILLELGVCYGCSGTVTFSAVDEGEQNDIG